MTALRRKLIRMLEVHVNVTLVAKKVFAERNLLPVRSTAAG